MIIDLVGWASVRELQVVLLGPGVGGFVDQWSLRTFSLEEQEKRAGKKRRKASDKGERVSIVVTPRSEEIFVLWAGRAIS